MRISRGWPPVDLRPTRDRRSAGHRVGRRRATSKASRRRPDQPPEPWDDRRRERAKAAARSQVWSRSRPRQWYETKRWVLALTLPLVAVAIASALFAAAPVQRTLAAAARPHVILACILTWGAVTLPIWAGLAVIASRGLSGRPRKIRVWMWICLGLMFALSLTVITPKRSSGYDAHRARLAENAGDMAKAIEAGAEAGAVTLLSIIPALFLTALLSKRSRESDRHFGKVAVAVIAAIAVASLVVALTAADLGPGHRAAAYSGGVALPGS